jgi:hypothetical protein
MNRSLFHWLALVAMILLIGLVTGAKAAKADPLADAMCGALFETARLAYVRDAVGIRVTDTMAEAEAIWRHATRDTPAQFDQIAPYIDALILEAYAAPKLTMGLHETWDRMVEEGAARFASDVEAECLMLFAER